VQNLVLIKGTSHIYTTASSLQPSEHEYCKTPLIANLLCLDINRNMKLQAVNNNATVLATSILHQQ